MKTMSHGALRARSPIAVLPVSEADAAELDWVQEQVSRQGGLFVDVRPDRQTTLWYQWPLADALPVMSIGGGMANASAGLWPRKNIRKSTSCRRRQSQAVI